jgi:hypothetical protein
LNISKLTEGMAQDKSYQAADSAVRAFEMAQSFERAREDSKKQQITLQSFMDDEDDEEERKRPRRSLLESKGRAGLPLTVKRGPFGNRDEEEPDDVESERNRNKRKS